MLKEKMFELRDCTETQFVAPLVVAALRKLHGEGCRWGAGIEVCREGDAEGGALFGNDAALAKNTGGALNTPAFHVHSIFELHCGVMQRRGLLMELLAEYTVRFYVAIEGRLERQEELADSVRLAFEDVLNQREDVFFVCSEAVTK